MAEIVFDNVPDDVLHAIIEFWHFREGDHIDEGEDLIDIKTPEGDTLTVTSPVSGILTDRLYHEEDEIEIGEVLAEIEEDTEVSDEDLNLNDFDDEDHEDKEEGLVEEEIEPEEEEESDDEEDEY